MYLLFSLQCVKIKEEKASTVEVLAFFVGRGEVRMIGKVTDFSPED